MFAAEAVKSRVVKVPLAKDYAHDVRAMLAAGRDAGVFYICNPNNPTGTVTSHSDIEYLVANKPKDSIVLVDEAYIHFSDTESRMDLVKADKDVLVLRTFSKIYGMAGLRCGVVFGKPALIEKVESYGGWNFMPITALAAASASLKDAQLVPERKRINADSPKRASSPGSTATDTPTSHRNPTASCSTPSAPAKKSSKPWPSKMSTSDESGQSGRPTSASR